MVRVDEVIVLISKDCWPFAGSSLFARGVGMGGALRLGGRRHTEGFVIQSVEILSHCTRCISGTNLAGRPILGVAPVLLLDIGANHTCIDREAMTSNQAFFHATRHGRLEYMAK
ncbi:MAG: hypothetical protein AAGD04_01725 [Pseudomonadota bacterium]